MANLRQLRETVLDDGIKNVNYFNGRVLTAADLIDEQMASRQQRQQLGLAIGAGVVSGLEVRLINDGAQQGSPVVSVNAGLAINRLGQAVDLAQPVQIALARQLAAPPKDAGAFGDCGLPQSGPDTIGKGAYILVAGPISGFREQAPRVGFGDNGKAAGCGSRYIVEGVSFGLIELKPEKLTGVSAGTLKVIRDLMTTSEQNSLPAATRQADMSKLRNMLAHLCYGTEELADFSRDPLRQIAGQSPFLSYGALDELRGRKELTNCAVPLALIYWTQYGVRFIDMWAVRRRPVPPPISATWPLPISARRSAEAEAIFQQFQGHVADIGGASNLAIRKAHDYFRYLPPAGMLPLPYNKATRSFATQTLFDGLTVRGPVFIEGASTESLIRLAAEYPPLDLSSGVMIWLYAVRENIQAIDTATANLPLAYLIFASGHMPFYGAARYDVNRWDYSNFV